jgi:RNA polymerase sigma-70 factor (ECF subfamily)
MANSPDFEKLVADFYGPLYQFAVSLSRDEAEACDLTQQTFFIWARKGHQLRDASKVKTWLFTTLHREFLAAARKNVRFPQIELDEAGAEIPAFTPPAASGIDCARVLEALSRVEQVYQAPVALFYLQDCSYAEMADILEVPMGTVKSRLSRGLAQLQQQLAGDIDLDRGTQPPNL